MGSRATLPRYPAPDETNRKCRCPSASTSRAASAWRKSRSVGSLTSARRKSLGSLAPLATTESVGCAITSPSRVYTNTTLLALGLSCATKRESASSSKSTEYTPDTSPLARSARTQEIPGTCLW